MPQAIVSGVYGAFIALYDESSQTKLLAKTRGKLRIQYLDKQNKNNQVQEHLLTVGDIVEYQLLADKTDIQASIYDVIPRKNSFSRSNLNRKQTLGANIDLVVALLSFDNPRFNRGFLDRLLVEAGFENIPIVIVINKSDAIDENFLNLSDNKDYYQKLLEQIDTYQNLPYPVYKESFRNYISNELRSLLREKTSIFIGQSGVGKSTLLNSLAENQIQATSAEDIFYRGKHTTTNSLMYFGQGQSRYIDTPGVREFGLQHLTLDDVQQGFKEFHQYRCSFADCQHLHEPNCAIKQALDAEQIASFRYESYRSIVVSLDQKYRLRKGNYWSKTKG